jgi:hypothetical protein
MSLCRLERVALLQAEARAKLSSSSVLSGSRPPWPPRHYLASCSDMSSTRAFSSSTTPDPAGIAAGPKQIVGKYGVFCCLCSDNALWLRA